MDIVIITIINQQEQNCLLKANNLVDVSNLDNPEIMYSNHYTDFKRQYNMGDVIINGKGSSKLWST